MTKKEVIWREILFQKRQNNRIKFTQKELAQKFGFSISTVFNALKSPRDANIVKVAGRFFVLEDYRRLLYLLASERSLKKEIYFKGSAGMDANALEGLMPPFAMFALYSAYKFLYGSAPADYDHVYIYLEKEKLPRVLERIASPQDESLKKLPPNFFVIAPDAWLKQYPQFLFEQIFVDIWNAPEWYAKDFLRTLEEKLTA